MASLPSPDVAPLCECQCGQLVSRHAKTGRWNRFVRFHHHRVRTGMEMVDSHASVSPSTADLYWAAGFLEGEGSFTFERRAQTVLHVVSCQQVQVEPLERLRDMLGGRICTLTQRRPENQIISGWKVSGARARSVMLTLHPIMSPKRQEQIVTALQQHRLEVEYDRQIASFT